MTEGVQPKIRQVLETCLYAEELDRAASFYEAVLGLEAFTRVAGRHVFFRAGDAVFLLFNPAATSRGGGEVPPHGARGPGHVAFAIGAADLEPWRDRLARQGIAVEAEVGWPGGGSSLYVRDPAGNSIELATPSIWGFPEPPGDGPVGV